METSYVHKTILSNLGRTEGKGKPVCSQTVCQLTDGKKSLNLVVHDFSLIYLCEKMQL
jgi:hypothetical protein